MLVFYVLFQWNSETREAESHKNLIFPSLMYAIFGLMIFYPGKRCFGSQRKTLLRNLYKVVFPDTSGVKFVEVLLGDILTSVSKAFGDILLSIFLFYLIFSKNVLLLDLQTTSSPLIREESRTAQSATFDGVFNSRVAEDGDSFEMNLNQNYRTLLKESEMYFVLNWFQPLMISIPFLLRFRQCYFQYNVEKKALKK